MWRTLLYFKVIKNKKNTRYESDRENLKEQKRGFVIKVFLCRECQTNLCDFKYYISCRMCGDSDVIHVTTFTIFTILLACGNEDWWCSIPVHTFIEYLDDQLSITRSSMCRLLASTCSRSHDGKLFGRPRPGQIWEVRCPGWHSPLRYARPSS